MSSVPKITREVFFWEGTGLSFGGKDGEAQYMGVKLGFPFGLTGIVVREIIDPDSKPEEIYRLSTNTELVTFKPVGVTTLHPSVIAVEGILSFRNPSYTREEIIDAAAVMMIDTDLESGQETGRIELPAVRL